jgi:hypothetical protein
MDNFDWNQWTTCPGKRIDMRQVGIDACQWVAQVDEIPLSTV